MTQALKLGMKISEIMTRDIATVLIGTSVADAARIMSERDVGMLPVMDAERVQGLVTDRDITIRAVAGGLECQAARVEDVMTTEVFYCYDDEDLEEAVECFEVKQIRRLLVFDRQDKLGGVLSIGDLAVDTGNKNLAGEVLMRVSEPLRD